MEIDLFFFAGFGGCQNSCSNRQQLCQRFCEDFKVLRCPGGHNFCQAGNFLKLINIFGLLGCLIDLN